MATAFFLSAYRSASLQMIPSEVGALGVIFHVGLRLLDRRIEGGMKHGKDKELLELIEIKHLASYN